LESRQHNTWNDKSVGSDESDVLRQPGESAQEQGKSVGIVESHQVRLFDGDHTLKLENGSSLGPIDVAYETYGQLNEHRDNAILITHALSGDAHVAGRHKPEDAKSGWWDNMIGPGKGFDTDKYFVICSNCLGGCMGATGPSSINPETNQPYGLNFPMITISDMVDVQKHLIDHLGIDKLLAVAGGSMGGMQVLDWAIRYPDRVAGVIPIATTARLSAQGIAFDAVGRNAIIRDENFKGGAFYAGDKYPSGGLAVARMVAHITYLSEEGMHRKFGRRLQHAADYKFDFNSEFSVETYLDHQGTIFVDRFDANTYLYFSKAMDYFDLPRQYGSLIQAMAKTRSRFLVVSFDSDWLFPPRQSEKIVNALLLANKDVTYCNINCPFGHDSFLLETKIQARLIDGFLEQTQNKLRNQSGRTVAPASLPKGKVSEPVGDQTLKAKGSIFTGKRVDHRQIEHLIKPNSTVLDLGCGDGELLRRLEEQKNIHGLGITLSEQDILKCAERGISVLQYNLDTSLDVFADKSYDYVVLSQTLQVIQKPQTVLRQMLRIGRHAIVSFPNFAYWRSRLQLMFKGHVPTYSALPYSWYDKPEEAAVNYMSISGFEYFILRELKARLIKRIPFSSHSGREVKFFPNFFANEAIFVIADRNDGQNG